MDGIDSRYVLFGGGLEKSIYLKKKKEYVIINQQSNKSDWNKVKIKVI